MVALPSLSPIITYVNASRKTILSIPKIPRCQLDPPPKVPYTPRLEAVKLQVDNECSRSVVRKFSPFSTPKDASKRSIDLGLGSLLTPSSRVGLRGAWRRNQQRRGRRSQFRLGRHQQWGRPEGRQCRPEARRCLVAAQPSVGEARPCLAAAQPSEGEARPCLAAARLSEGEAQPSEGEAQPSEGEARPCLAAAQPSEGEAQPSEGEARPSEGEAQPSEAGARPCWEGAQPSEGAARPSGGEARLSEGAWSASGEEQSESQEGSSRDSW